MTIRDAGQPKVEKNKRPLAPEISKLEKISIASVFLLTLIAAIFIIVRVIKKRKTP